MLISSISLTFEIREDLTWDEKLEILVPMLQARTGAIIIYVTARKTSEELARTLNSRGLPADFYHSSVEAEDRERIQHKFMQSNDHIVCATMAFGMGVNKGTFICEPSRYRLLSFALSCSECQNGSSVP